MTENILTGYARRSTAEDSLKLSLNRNALRDCDTYTAQDGMTYIPLQISLSDLRLLLNRERAVITVRQEVKEKDL